MVLILLAAVVLRLLFLPFFEGENHDGVHRTGMAARWLEQPYTLEGTTPWPLLNYVLPGLAIFLTHEFYWSVRVLYFLVALSNIVVLYLAVKEFVDREAGLIAALLLAVNPFHVRLSLNGAMSEPAFVTLALLALFLAARFRTTRDLKYVIGAGAAVSMATMFRFDAVLFGPIAAYVIMTPRGRILPQLNAWWAWRAVLLLAVLCSLYPLFLGARWNALYGDPLYFFHTTQANSTQFFKGGSHARFPLIYPIYTIVFWPASAFLILTPVLAGLSFLGLFRALVRRENSELAVVYLMMAAWLMYSAFNHSILAQFRYTIILQVLLLAYFASGATMVLRRIPALSRKALYAVTAVVGIVTWIGIITLGVVDRGTAGRQLGSISPVQPGSYASRAALKWIDQNAKPGERVLVTPEATSAYLGLAGRDRIKAGELDQLSIYQPDGNSIYSKDEMGVVFRQRAAGAAYVLLNAETGSLGLRDGLVSGIVSPPSSASSGFVEHGVAFTAAATFGPLRLYRITPQD